MKKSLFEEMGGTYRQEGDYLLPNLTVPQSTPVGIWGQRRRNYLQQHKEPIYIRLLLAGKLDAHLVEVDRQAEEMYFQLVDQMAQAEGINEYLKAIDQMTWVGKMNNIRNQAEEIINNDLICV